ncbi:MAG: hypothetical protein M3O02_00935, partial [Acidobacteriota bacterium]|nr:hypothetical protein [Acidobacteriota bacterium]
MICLDSSERYFDANGQRVAAPAGLWNFLRENARDLSAWFGAVQLPPAGKTQSGNHPTGDGDGVFDKRDLGTKLQQGSVGTYFGTGEELLAAIAALYAHGMEAWPDLVLHQAIGENGGPGVFRFVGADGKTLNGRGGTAAGWFRGQCNPILDRANREIGWHDPIPPFSPQDPCPSPRDDNAFGREYVYRNCVPEGASLEDAVDYIRWFLRRTGLAKPRLDDMKGIYQGAVSAFLDAIQNEAVGEYFSGNEDELDGWALSQPISGRCAVYDFPWHFAIQDACNSFDARKLAGRGYWRRRPGLAVVFVQNRDTDTSPGQQVIFNGGIAYALTLGVPALRADVSAKDFFAASAVWPQAYGLSNAGLTTTCWFHNTFAFGGFAERWVDQDVYAYTRDGNGGSVGWSGGCLVAANFNTLTPRHISVYVPFWNVGEWIHDYSGHCPDGRVREGHLFDAYLPSNAYSGGMSYGLWAPGGVHQPGQNAGARAITQTFVCEFDAQGLPDLDVMPVMNAMRRLPQRLRCAEGSSIRLAFTMERGQLPADAAVQIE